MSSHAKSGLAAGPIVLAGLLALGGCGLVGPLEQPAPMFGAKAKADFQARKAAEAAAAKGDKEDSAPEPLAPDTPPATSNAAPMPNLRTDPPPGMRDQPNAPAPPGVLPDPFNHPQ